MKHAEHSHRPGAGVLEAVLLERWQMDAGAARDRRLRATQVEHTLALASGGIKEAKYAAWLKAHSKRV